MTLAVIVSVVDQKLKRYYESCSMADEISEILSAFDIVNLLTASNNERLESIEKVNQAWSLMHGNIFKRIFLKTAEQLGRDANEDVNDVIKKVGKKEFNKKLKLNLNQDTDFQRVKLIISDYVRNFKPILTSHLGEARPKTETASPEIAGDIGVSEYDVDED